MKDIYKHLVQHYDDRLHKKDHNLYVKQLAKRCKVSQLVADTGLTKFLKPKREKHSLQMSRRCKTGLKMSYYYSYI